MTKKRFPLLLMITAAVLTLLMGMSVSAASCTCQQTSMPHNSSHQVEYVKEADGHYTYCISCLVNGHAPDCAQVTSSKTAHTFTVSGTTRRCTVCSFTETIPCVHANAKWLQHRDTDTDTCVKYCDDCHKVSETGRHDWAYRQINETILTRGLKQHEAYCRKCGYSYDQAHTLKTTSKAYAAQRNFALVADYRSPALYHMETASCALCGFANTTSEKHTFKKDKCTACSLSRKQLAKVKGASGKQLTKIKTARYKRPAEWRWSGSKLYYYPAGTYRVNSTRVKISWKKAKGAYGYYYSINKKELGKKGAFLTSDDVKKSGTTGFTKKTSVKIGISPTKGMKKAKVYVAPVSKYGYIGKIKTIEIKLSW